MEKFIEIIRTFIMLLQPGKNLNSTYSYNLGGNKTFMSGTEHLTINSHNEAIKASVKNDVEALAKEYKDKTELYLEYIQKSGTNIYKIRYADRILSYLGEDEGVVFEQSGFKALILSLITGQGFRFKTKTMFILREGYIEPLSMLHNFYKWYSWSKNLPGFDKKSQKLFKRYMKFPNADLSKLPLDDIISAEEAVARDKEATDFCLNFARETEGAKNVQRKMNEEGGANI